VEAEGGVAVVVHQDQEIIKSELICYITENINTFCFMFNLRHCMKG